MTWYIYILLSQSKLHWYIGSSGNLPDRLRRHNGGMSKSTKPYRPWNMVYTESFNTLSEAVRRERYLKSPQGYKEYQQIKNNILGEFA